MILSHSVSGSIIVKASSMRGSPRTSILILYGTIRSTAYMYHGMAYDSLAGNFPSLKFCFLFFYQYLLTLKCVRISPLKVGH